MKFNPLIWFAALILIPLLNMGAHAQSVGAITPPKQQLGTYVVTSGPGLNTGPLFRSGGPIVIQIAVPPVVNPAEIGADGKLLNPRKLKDNNVIGPYAIIEFPAWDIDDKTPPPTAGAASEVDKVTFNGKDYGALSGMNNKWVSQTIKIPIEEVKFSGGPGGAISNELRIDIDTANASFNQSYCTTPQAPTDTGVVNLPEHCGIGEVWSMEVNWVAITLDVAAPYVLVHGIAADYTTWDESDAPGVITFLNNLGLAWNRFTGHLNGSVAANAHALNDQISTWLQSMQADRVHIIAHSKGGLDSQMLAYYHPKFKILSLSTLSTPHYGSVVADVTSLETYVAGNLQNTSNDPHGYVGLLLGLSGFTGSINQGPQPPGLWDLKTNEAALALMRGQRATIDPTYAIGASADRNNNHILDGTEADGMLPHISGTWAVNLLTPSYQVALHYSSASIVDFVPGYVFTPGSFIPTPVTTLEFSTHQASSLQENDIVVSESSAHPTWADNSLGNFESNHSGIKAAINVCELISRPCKTPTTRMNTGFPR